VKEDEMDRTCSTYREKSNSYRIMLGKLEVNRPLGRPRSKWEDDIKMDHEEIEWGGMDWIDLAHIRDQWRAPVNTVINFRVQ
jgi:hypothetical protein